MRDIKKLKKSSSKWFPIFEREAIRRFQNFILLGPILLKSVLNFFIRIDELIKGR